MNSSKSQSFFGIRKLPARYAGVVMPFILSVVMTCVVSMISTFRSVGWGGRLHQGMAQRLGAFLAHRISHFAVGAAAGAQADHAGGPGRLKPILHLV